MSELEHSRTLTGARARAREDGTLAELARAPRASEDAEPRALVAARLRSPELAEAARTPRASGGQGDNSEPRGMVRPTPLPSALAEALAGSPAGSPADLPETMDGPRPVGAQAGAAGRLRKLADVAADIAACLREEAAKI